MKTPLIFFEKAGIATLNAAANAHGYALDPRTAEFWWHLITSIWGGRGREPGKHHCVPSENLLFLTVQFKISNPEAKWSEHFLPPVLTAHQELSEGEDLRPVQQNRDARKESSPTVAKAMRRVSLFIHYAEELKIETFYMSHLRPGWTAVNHFCYSKWLENTDGNWGYLAHPSNPGKSLYCCMFLQGGNKIRATIFSFFSLIKLEKQRLIYEASPLPAIPAMSPSFPMDVKLQKSTEDKRHLGNASHPVLQLWRSKKRI